MVFPVVMYGCENWTIKKGERRRVESPFDFMEIQPVHPKGDMSWVFIGSTDVEAETPILWPPNVKSWLTGKDSDAGKDWRQEEKDMTEDEMVGWHHWLNRHEFEQAPEIGDGQGSLVCCSPWGHKESDMTEQLNWTVTYLYLNRSVAKSLLKMNWIISKIWKKLFFLWLMKHWN